MDRKVVLGLIKIARCLGVEEMINKSVICLEISPGAQKRMKTSALWKMIRSQIRYGSVVSVHQCYVRFSHLQISTTFPRLYARNTVIIPCQFRIMRIVLTPRFRWFCTQRTVLRSCNEYGT